MTSVGPRIAALWRGQLDVPVEATRNHARLAPIFHAMNSVGIAVEAVIYDDAAATEITARLADFDGVLVWVDPVHSDGDRTRLDEVLREVARTGTWVSAHPDTIMKMGTKEVLYRTRSLGWGAETRLYSSVSELQKRFPESLASSDARVVKQNRGNGGIGVWKVMLIDADAQIVRVQHAAPRDDVTEDVSLDAFVQRCAPYFEASGKMIDQPFAHRIVEGMIRAYFIEHEVVGFARQQATSQAVDPNAPAPERVLGMPSTKTMYDADAPQFERLRRLLENEWVRGLQRCVDLADRELPLLWDADFLYGPRADDGTDTYMLCEINVSSVIPFPDAVPEKLAAAVKRRCS